jgi:hypothetical protein
VNGAQRHEGRCLCGTVRYRIDGPPRDDAQMIPVAAGTLDEPTGLRTVAQIFTATAGDYYKAAGEGERFEYGLPDPGPG